MSAHPVADPENTSPPPRTFDAMPVSAPRDTVAAPSIVPAPQEATVAQSEELWRQTYILHSDIMVPMRDGVRLATDVYLPAAQGTILECSFPVILERTPYDKTAPSRSERSVADAKPLSRAQVAAHFTARGYAFVYQDCRGTHHSEGRFTKYLSEGEDGYDTIAWIAAQPWCAGAVGMMGLSYAAHTQVAAACLSPPALAALFVDSGGFHDAYQGGIRQGGAFELKQATWAMRQAMQSPEAGADPLLLAALEAEMADISAWFTRMPWKRGLSPLRWLPEFEDYLFDQWSHGSYDAFWRQLGICSAAFMEGFADVPMVHMSSWYDPYPRTATNNYLGLSARKTGPVRLILGPWTHGDRCLSFAGDVDFGPEAPLEGSLAANFLELRSRWFDRWLKGEHNGVDTEPTLRYFRMGGGSGTKNAAGRLDHGGMWLCAQDWPPPDARQCSLHLCADNSLDFADHDTSYLETNSQKIAQHQTGTLQTTPSQPSYRIQEPVPPDSTISDTAPAAVKAQMDTLASRAPQTRSLKAGTPCPEAPREAASFRYQYDPARPIPSIGGTITSGEPIMRGGAFNQVEDARFFGCTPPFLPLSSRPDILVFRSPILEKPIEVTGPVSAELWISSDCPDTDFTIKLIDEYPPSPDYPRGFAMNITDGILRARYRDSWEHPSLMEPGQVYRILVEAFPTSNLFAKGHRIRLDISSSNFPHFDANPNTGSPEGSGLTKRVATNTLHVGVERPSRLKVWIRGQRM